MFNAMFPKFGLLRFGSKKRRRQSEAPVVATVPTTPTRLPAELLARAKEARVLQFHEAVRTFAASVGQIGVKPNSLDLEKARDAIPVDAWSYLAALALDERRIPLLPENRVGIREAEDGFRLRVMESTYCDLDTWSAVASREARELRLARVTGRVARPPIVIPAEVLHKLAERDRLRGRPRRRRRPDDDPEPT